MPTFSNTTAIGMQVSYKDTIGGSVGTFSPAFSVTQALSDGVAANNADQVWWHVGRTLAATTNDDLDLTGGLTDAFGAAQTYVKIKGIFINNNNTVAGDNLEVGGQATADFLLFNAIGDKYILGPAGTFVVVEPSLAGLTVTATTADIFRIRNPGSNTVTFDIFIIGTTA